MLRADLVVGAVVATFEEGPEGLYTVGMGLPIHVLADAVLDRGVVGESTVGGVLVGVDGSSRRGSFRNERDEGIASVGLDDLGANCAGLSVLRSNNQ